MGIRIEKREEVGKNGQRGDEEIRTLCSSKAPLLGCVTLFYGGHWRFYYLCGPCYTPSKTFHCPVSGLSTKEKPPNFWEIGYSNPLTQLNSIVLFISISQELLWLIINKRVQGIRGLHCQCQGYTALPSSPDRSDSVCVFPPHIGRKESDRRNFHERLRSKMWRILLSANSCWCTYLGSRNIDDDGTIPADGWITEKQYPLRTWWFFQVLKENRISSGTCFRNVAWDFAKHIFSVTQCMVLHDSVWLLLFLISSLSYERYFSRFGNTPNQDM